MTSKLFITIGLTLLNFSASKRMLRFRNLESESYYEPPNGVVAIVNFLGCEKHQDPKMYLESRLSSGNILDSYVADSLNQEIILYPSLNEEILDSLIDYELDAEKLETAKDDEFFEDAWTYGMDFFHEIFPLDGDETEIQVTMKKVPVHDPSSDKNEAMFYLVQETSIAEVAYFVGSTQPLRDEIEDPAMSQEDVLLIAADPITMVATALLNKLASEAGAYVWGQIVKELPGGGLPSYYDDVFAEMKKIVRHESIENRLCDLKKNAEKFQKAMDWYRGNPVSMVNLNAAEQEAREIVTASKLPILYNQGAFYHAEGVAYRIMVLQESYKLQKEDKSISASSLEVAKENIVKQAKEGATELRAMRDALITARLSLISGVELDFNPVGNYGSGKNVAGVIEGKYQQVCTWSIVGGCSCYREPKRICVTGGCELTNGDIAPWNMFRDDFSEGIFVRNFMNPICGLECACLGSDYSWKWVNAKREHYYHVWTEHLKIKFQPLTDAAAKLDAIAANPVPGL